MAIDFGSAIRMFRADGTLDPDLGGPLLTGPRVALEAAAVTIMTHLGGLWYDDAKGVTTPLQDLVNFTGTDGELQRIAGEYGAAVEDQVEQIVSAQFIVRRVDKGVAVGGSIALSSGLVAPLVASLADALTVLFPTVPA